GAGAEEIRFAAPPRGQQRIAAGGERARFGLRAPRRGRLGRAERGVEVRHHPGPPAGRVRGAPVRPQRVDLGRSLVLVAFAERAPVRSLRLAAARGEVVRPRGATRGEDAPQPAQLVDADLGTGAQEREGGRSESGGESSAGGTTGSGPMSVTPGTGSPPPG